MACTAGDFSLAIGILSSVSVASCYKSCFPAHHSMRHLHATSNAASIGFVKHASWQIHNVVLE